MGGLIHQNQRCTILRGVRMHRWERNACLLLALPVGVVSNETKYGSSHDSNDFVHHDITHGAIS